VRAVVFVAVHFEDVVIGNEIVADLHREGSGVILQAPKETMILYEVDNLHRQVFADGRKFPESFEFPARLGYSIGRWGGDTFVVETRGFNEETPIDGMGHPRSEAMHVTEQPATSSGWDFR
jgi:hypothetical protein